MDEATAPSTAAAAELRPDRPPPRPDRSAEEPLPATRATLGALWIPIYFVLAAAPLAVALTGDRPPGRGFWTELSVALGFVGLSMIGLQFVLTARFRAVAEPYGLDAVLQFHRQISVVAFAFVLAHPLILVVRSDWAFELFDPVDAPWRRRFGIIALVALVAIVVTSLWRRRLGLTYEAWRVLHGVLAVVIVATALAHVYGVGHYVSTPGKQVFWGVMSATLVAVLVWVRVVKPVRMLRRPYVVEEVVRRSGDTFSLVLRPDGHDGLRFQAGQFVWLTLGGPPFLREEHPFSFSSSAASPDRLELTVKALGDFTRAISEVEPGTRAYLDGPYGAFTSDRNEGPGFVFVAGGIGVTPILSMLRTLAERDDARPVVLVYANPRWEDVAFAEELDALAERLDLMVVHVLEDPPDDWAGERGLVDESLLERVLPLHRERFEYFVCGPPPMIHAVERALGVEGVPRGRIHSERFDLV